MREVIIKTEATTEPVTTAEVKTFVGYLGVDATFEGLLVDLITSARLRLEHFTGRNFAEKTMILSTDSVGMGVVLPYGPIRAITSVKVYDSYGALDSTLTADEDYYLLGLFDKILKLESFFDGSRLDVEYTAGYGANTYALPEVMKTAIKRQVKYDWDNRGNPNIETIAPEVRSMLMPFVCNFL